MSILDKKHVLTINLDDSSIDYDKKIKFFNTDKNISNLYVKIVKNNADRVKAELSETDLAGLTLKLTVVKPKTNQIRTMSGVLTKELTEQTCAIYKFDLSSDFTNQVGLVCGEFELSDGLDDGEVVTTDPFSYEIKSSKLTGLNAEIESNPDLPVLKGLIEEVKETAQTVNNIDNVNVSDIKTYSNKKIEEKFSGVSSQIKDIENNIKTAGLRKTFDKLNKGESANIIFIGDSTTQGIDVSANLVDRIKKYLQVDLGYGNKANVLNKGIGGNTTVDGWNRCLNDVINNNADCVVICFGINDVTKTPRIPLDESIKAYRNIIDYILAYCGNDTDIILNTFNIPRNLTNPSIPDFIDFNLEVKKLANEYGLIFADYYSYMSGLNFTQEQILDYFLDSIHPNDKGYELKFNFLKRFFIPCESKYIKEINTMNYVLKNNKFITTTGSIDITNPPTNVNYPGGEYLGGNRHGDSVKITFFGCGIKLMLTKSSSAGNVEIKLDGSVLENCLDLYNEKLDWINTYEIKGLEEKEHNLELSILSTKNENSTNYNILMSGIVVETKDRLNQNIFYKLKELNLI